MYMVMVCIVCATAVVAVASVIFVMSVAAVTISHGAKYAWATLHTLWHDRILASVSQDRLLLGLAPRRVR